MGISNGKSSLYVLKAVLLTNTKITLMEPSFQFIMTLNVNIAATCVSNAKMHRITVAYAKEVKLTLQISMHPTYSQTTLLGVNVSLIVQLKLLLQTQKKAGMVR